MTTSTQTKLNDFTQCDVLYQAVIEKLSDIPEHFSVDSPLLDAGLDSMQIMLWLSEFRQQGYIVALSQLYENPTIRGWSLLLSSVPHNQQLDQTRSDYPVMVDQRPFPLTPVQHAYFIGRQSHQILGGVGCHLYQEFNCSNINVEQLESAWRQLTSRHRMFHVHFTDNAQQCWHEEDRWRGITVHDLQNLDTNSQQHELFMIRQQLSHRRLNVEEGETFDVQVSLLSNKMCRIHINLDLLIADAASFTLIFDELSLILQGSLLPELDPHYDFCSYLSQKAQETAQSYQTDREYWLSLLHTFPAAPALPLAILPEQITTVRMHRRSHTISAVRWAIFQQYASQFGITATMALVTCFAAVCARWSNQPNLLINLTLFDRQPLHPAVESMIADFTNILLLNLNVDESTFAQQAQRNQMLFTDAFDHRGFSGVEILRELKKQHQHPYGAPLVFTSNLGRKQYGNNNILGEPGWGISQTPQVWIDSVVFEQQEQVILQWDSHDALFNEAVVEEMFSAYCSLVENLIEEEAQWQISPVIELPESQRQHRELINNTSAPVTASLLHHGIFIQAATNPDDIAVITDDRTITYAELCSSADSLAVVLSKHIREPGQRIAICMRKGLGQIVAVLAILRLGGVYVPIAPEQPTERIQTILRNAEVAAVIINHREELNDYDILSGEIPFISWYTTKETSLPIIIDVHPDQPAYIIYTSGSTGVPKGVVVSHRSALNTCLDINQRYQVKPADRVLALAALYFDLSVYDIFGLLNAGGSLVLLTEKQARDPEAWCQAIERYNVTIWNSVPALLDMLLTYSEGFELTAPAQLRLVLLSGDWIGLDLPERYHIFRQDGRFIAMGGATEAAIWSNAYEVSKIEPYWHSIPYGYPLTNQCYRVVDSRGLDCPDWVAGELWIGGVGVAQGYFADSERTAKQFFTDNLGQRWYRTGDMGRYWPDGRLEFLGRQDRQVKINGFRIELGEVESIINHLPFVNQSIAMTIGDKEKTLIAFIKLEVEDKANASLQSNDSSDFMIDILGKIETGFEDDALTLVSQFLRKHFADSGIEFVTPLSLEQIISQYGAKKDYQQLLQQWLDVLVDRQMLDYQCGQYVQGPLYSVSHTFSPKLRPLSTALVNHSSLLKQIISGQDDAITLLLDPELAPEVLLAYLPESDAMVDQVVEMVENLAAKFNRPVNMLEIGAGMGIFANKILAKLSSTKVHYLGIDNLKDRVLHAQQYLKNYSHATVDWQRLEHLSQQDFNADLVLINNQLHQQTSINNSLSAICQGISKQSIIIVYELAQAPCLSLLSAAVLEKIPLSHRLASEEFWLSTFKKQGLLCQSHEQFGVMQRFILSQSNYLQQSVDTNQLKELLGKQLPYYMVPSRLFLVNCFPLSANGKIDHKALLGLITEEKVKPEYSPLSTDAERLVAQCWQELLPERNFHRQSDFFQLGGDSLLATRLISLLANHGYTASLSNLFISPKLSEFAATLSVINSDDIASNIIFPSQDAQEGQPFALTPVQRAYLLGREKALVLGGVGSHFFAEFTVYDLDVSRFENAVDQLVERHPMLRTIIEEEQQRTLSSVPNFTLETHLVTSYDTEQVQVLRDLISNSVPIPTQYPVFSIIAIQDGSHKTLLWFSLDNLFLDGMSMQTFFVDLEKLYKYPDKPLSSLNITFQRYLSQTAQNSCLPESVEYWRKSLPSLPLAPQLELVQSPQTITEPRFTRRHAMLTAERWQNLKTYAMNNNLTPSIVLLNSYALVLSMWSRQAELTINLTLFDRLPIHDDIDRVIGDFTTLLLLAWYPDKTWLESAKTLQYRMANDLDHRDVSAITLLHQLSEMKGYPVSMPIVFTSAIGSGKGNFLASKGWLHYERGISQTPQIWLDNQVYESENCLRIHWDAVEALFQPQQLQLMFDQYVGILEKLSDDPNAWSLPLESLLVRQIPLVTPIAERLFLPNKTTNGDGALIELIIQTFKQVVGSSITAKQNFFDAGASSLQLVKLHIELTSHHDMDLVVTDLFVYPSPQKLAEKLVFSPQTQSNQQQSRLTLSKRRQQRRLQKTHTENGN